MTNNLLRYKQLVDKQHQSRAIRAYFDLYAFIWFHVEALWIEDPEDRRPFTFIIHDACHAHPWGYAIVAVVAMGFLYATWWVTTVNSWLVIVLGLADMVYALFMGHIFYGGWKIGEQEWPPYPPRG